MGKAFIAQDLSQRVLKAKARRDHREIAAPGEQANKYLQELIGWSKIYSFHRHSDCFERVEYLMRLIVS
jgi:hypothetical protein